jgi:hypothetical protein
MPVQIGELLLRERGIDPSTGRTVFELLEDFTVQTGLNGEQWSITVPKGFLTDFASVPRRIPFLLPDFIAKRLPVWVRWIGRIGIPLWLIFPPSGRYNKAAVVHDWLYRGKIVDRFLADAVFRYLMKELKTPFWKRFIMFYAVRLGGRSAFGSDPPKPEDIIEGESQ